MPLLVSVACAVLLLVQGCTLHFKATDLEMETQTSDAFELESVGLLDG